MSAGAPTIRLHVNGEKVVTRLPGGSVLLDFLRRERGLSGVKEGCREGDCGACTVLVGSPEGGRVRYRTAVSCLLPLADAENRHVVTIEGLNGAGLSPVQQAIVDQGATQCGFCTPGLVVSLTGFLLESPVLDMEEAAEAMEGNLCRCTGYASIRRAAAALVERFSALPEPAARLPALVEAGVVPAYFLGMADKLAGHDAVLDHGGALVAGGTDLYVQKPDELANGPVQLLTRRAGMAGIHRDDAGRVRIGAATPLEDLRRSPLLAETVPALAPALTLVSALALRNRATVGGNIVNASPIGDLTIMLLALGAELELGGERRERTVPLADFFLGYKKLALHHNEWLRAVFFTPPPGGASFRFEKVAKRAWLDIASVNSAACLRLEQGRIAAGARLSAGGVAPVPLLLRQAGRFLAGREPGAETLQGAVAAAAAEISPISDVRGSADYKRKLLGRLLAAHLLALAPGCLGARDLP